MLVGQPANPVCPEIPPYHSTSRHLLAAHARAGSIRSAAARSAYHASPLPPLSAKGLTPHKAVPRPIVGVSSGLCDRRFEGTRATVEGQIPAQATGVVELHRVSQHFRPSVAWARHSRATSCINLYAGLVLRSGAQIWYSDLAAGGRPPSRNRPIGRNNDWSLALRTALISGLAGWRGQLGSAQAAAGRVGA